MKCSLVLFLVCVLNISFAQILDFKTIDFTKADNTAKLYKGHSLNSLPILAHKLTHKLSTDVEKFRAIYTWVCLNISGDAKQHNKVSRTQEKYKKDSLGYIMWSNEYKKIAFKKLLNSKKTMCTGYAYLIKELCFIANIECKIIDGYGRSFETNVEALESLNHSWNAVKLNNQWYLCDATWSSGHMVNGSVFVKDYNNGYFLTEPILFAKNHIPIKKKWFLNDNLSNTIFMPEPIVYGETFKQQILPITPKRLITKVNTNEEVSFSFKPLKTVSLDDVSLIQIYKYDHKPYKIYDLEYNESLITFKYKFKYKGVYDVHLKIKNDIVVSYNIKVSKP